MDDRLARAYRHARREPWNNLGTTPARWAMVKARAEIKGSRLSGEAEQDDKYGSYALHWSLDIGAGIVVEVWQVSDEQSCDCWDWAKENPRDDGEEDDIPEHGHFGIVAEVRWFGREIASDACWGFVWDWPSQSDERELAYAWEQVAEPVIESARETLASLPAWVVQQMAAWEEVA